MKKIGIFSGSFDPVHIGHVETALVARAALELEKVLIFVEKNPQHKKIKTPYNDRLSMLQLALGDYQSIQAVESDQKSITIKGTLAYLSQHYPEYKPVLIIGSDMLEYIESWTDSDELFKQMDIAVVLRSLDDQKATDKQVQKLKSAHAETEFTVLPPVWSPVSSSQVKKDLANSNTTDSLHKDVISYITKNKLY